MGSLKTYLLAGALGVSALGGWMGHNWIVYQPHLKKDIQAGARAVIAARDIERAGAKIATKARDALDTKQETIRATTQTIIKAIPYYVPEADQHGVVDGTTAEGGPRVGGVGVPGVHGGGPSLSVGFGRLHDYAALGIDPPVPAPSGEPLGEASGIGLPALAETLAGNYGVCHAAIAENEAWRGWYRKEAGAWPSK